jgi:hypothetical protein
MILEVDGFLLVLKGSSIPAMEDVLCFVALCIGVYIGVAPFPHNSTDERLLRNLNSSGPLMLLLWDGGR